MKSVIKKLSVSCLVICLCITSAVVFSSQPVFASPTVYNQKGNALSDYTVKGYKVVKNKKMTRQRYSYGYWDLPTLKSTKGCSVVFQRYDADLASKGIIDYDSGYGACTPQSLAVTPDGQTAYIMCVYKNESISDNKWKGYIVKYSIPQKAVIYKGPVFTTGHGQAMAINPKNGQLWIVGATKTIKTNVQQISTSTLLPVKKINFKLSKTVQMGNNLAFDKKGNVYFYTRSNGGWSPKNSIKIYKGKIKKKSVQFKLIMQGIKYPPGQIGQSLGYNPKNNRLYIVDDGEIISVPVSKLGKLKKKHVKTTVFEGNREFEGVAFDKAGRGYFLTNRPYELMQIFSSTGF